ncbi:Gfo/Idh/MocA family protein [Amycolatopsis sp. VS8301801F10]|uniref:Gfo/Idh/MocA family protein n=1 Tax=Amycolatopsis sp. VS8301801F10 TaxID=2652442 RepID=UPI0038FC7D77
MTRPVRLFVVGAGWAGRRFVRAIRHSPLLDLAGICDHDERALAEHRSLAVPCHSDLSTALEQLRPDAVCVCVNESAHHAVLTELARHPAAPELILCEKPLTENLAQARAVAPALAGKRVRVNLVERQSEIVAELRDWMAGRSLDVRRVEFFWGKCRVEDLRPTMGDATEVVHPLDLVRYLLRLPATAETRVLHAIGTSSDFSPAAGALPDSLSCQLTMGDVLVIGNSSFLWDERRRRIILYATDDQPGILQIVLSLDEPEWDDDSYWVWRIGTGGERVQVAAGRRRADEHPAAVRGIAKVCRFLESACACGDADSVVDLAGALWVQGVLEDLIETADSAGRSAMRLREPFAASVPG